MQRPTSLPAVMLNAAIAAYRTGEPLQKLAARFHIHWLTLRTALADAGVPIRSRGWPAGQVRPAGRALVAWEAGTARGEARDAKSETARLARLDRRCDCGGIVRASVAHKCDKQNPPARKR